MLNVDRYESFYMNLSIWAASFQTTANIHPRSPGRLFSAVFLVYLRLAASGAAQVYFLTTTI
jgi:hypothetical protein